MMQNVVKSHFSSARNFILLENSQVRSSQPRQATKRYTTVSFTFF